MSGIRRSLYLAAPVERVWACLTDREKLSAWLMDNDLALGDARAFTFTAKPSGAWDGRVHCEVRDVIEHERFSFTWRANDIGSETLVTFELAPHRDGTRLVLTHTGFESARAGAEGRHAAGWTNRLKALEESLTGPRHGYDWSEIQITSYIEAPPGDVYRLWATAEGMQAFWAEDVRHAPCEESSRPAGRGYRTGDRVGLTFTTGAEPELEILNVGKNESLLFSFGEDYGFVRVSLAAEGGRTRMHLHHFGLPTEGQTPWTVHAHARGWWVYNLANLKSVLLHGRDLRVRDPRAATGLSVDFQPDGKDGSPAHDWRQFDIHLQIDAPPGEVMARWRTRAGLESFFVGEARIARGNGIELAPDDEIRAGDTYAWEWLHGLSRTGEFLAADTDRVTFSFGERYLVEVSAAAHANSTLLRLRQSGMADTPGERVTGSLNCRCCWIHYLAMLKARIEHGIDLRDHDPRTAGSIGVEIPLVSPRCPVKAGARS